MSEPSSSTSSENSEFEVQTEIIVKLDDNAGIIPSPDVLAVVQKTYQRINNLHGFCEAQRSMKLYLKGLYEKLRAALEFDIVYFNYGSSQMLNLLATTFGDAIKYYPNPHPGATDQPTTNTSSGAPPPISLITLVTSAQCLDQRAQLAEAKGAPFVVVDATQAIGRIKLPTQNDGVACLFFSCHKYGGLFDTGFAAMSNRFATEMGLLAPRDDIGLPTMCYGTMNVPGVECAFTSTLACLNHLPDERRLARCWQTLAGVVRSCQQLQIVEPTGPHLNSAILFKTRPLSTADAQHAGLCVRSLQNYFSKAGIQIGFSSACRSTADGTLRLSWREPLSQSQLDYCVKTFKRVCDECEQATIAAQTFEDRPFGTGTYSAGARKNPILPLPQQIKFNLRSINKNMFWLRHHWVSSKEKKLVPPIPAKYAIMFPDWMLKQRQEIALNIPGVQEHHRLSKHVWINPIAKRRQIDAELTIANFEKNQFPPIVSQLFDGKYQMCAFKYQFIKKHALDIDYEYARKYNPMNEYVWRLFVQKNPIPVRELLISTCNMYHNNYKFPKGLTGCERFRGIYEESESSSEHSNENTAGIEKIIATIGGSAPGLSGGARDNSRPDPKPVKYYDVPNYEKIISDSMKGDEFTSYCDTITEQETKGCVVVIQPFMRIGELDKAMALAKQMVEWKAKAILILRNPPPRFEPPTQFKNVKSLWCVFDNFDLVWQKDPEYQIFTLNTFFDE